MRAEDIFLDKNKRYKEMSIRLSRRKLVFFIAIFFSFTSFIYFVYFRDGIELLVPETKSLDELTNEIESRLSALERGLKDSKQLLDNVQSRIDHVSSAIRLRNDFKVVKHNKNTSSSSSLHEKIENIYNQLKFDNPDGGAWKQGWNIEINENKFRSNQLRIFVVPHSHNDPGWLKTFDQYFQSQSRHILNNMLKKLSENSKLTFIWAEISFFSSWWDTLKGEDEKEMVKTLLDNGQLEIVTGGWVMNDEATTSYFAIISQLLLGHRWLKDNLNYKPHYGWAIDPFGLSPTMAFLLERMGFKGMVIQRVHYAVKKYLAMNRLLEFHWKQAFTKQIQEQQQQQINYTIENQNTILCHIEPFYSYDIPHTCGPDPKICCQFDFKRLPPSRVSCPWKIPPQKITSRNVEARARLLLDQYKKKSMLFRSNTLLVPLGDDFRYDKLNEWQSQFENYQKLFDYMNSREDWNVEIKFGTLASYFQALSSDITFTESIPSFDGDFFTYSDREDNYWSGYYSSRPFYKRYDRILESYLRSAEIIYSLASITSGYKLPILEKLSPLLTYARQNLALFQHHDAITGTAKDPVVKDYAFRVLQSILNTQKIITDVTANLLHYPNEELAAKLTFVEHYNNSEQLPFTNKITLTTDNTRSSAVVYNSLAVSRTELICLIIMSNYSNWIIRDSNGKLIDEVQVNSVWNFDVELNDVKEACFLAQLKPLSLTQFLIELIDNSKSIYKTSEVSLYNFNNVIKAPKEIIITSDQLSLIFNGADGMLRQVTKNDIGDIHNVRLQFMTYGTRKGHKAEKSGAYLFLPDSDEAQAINYGTPRIRVVSGSLMSKVEVLIKKPLHMLHQITIVKGEKDFSIDNYFDLNEETMNNQELIMRLYTNINNEENFYTDLNGLQMTHRKYYDKIPLQGNVYPLPTMVYIEDEQTRLNLLTAQPLGVTSRHSGFIEIFLDRRLLQDDNRGVNQGVTDNKLTKEKFRLLIEQQPQIKKFQQQEYQKLSNKLTYEAQINSLKLSNPIHIMYNEKYGQIYQGDISYLTNDLPCDIHLLKLRSNSHTHLEYSLFLHRYGVINDDKQCLSGQKFTLGSKLSSKILNAIEPLISRQSLSLLDELESGININENEIDINEMDFLVYNLQLK